MPRWTLPLVLALAGCPTGAVEICGNGVDDDLDGLTDCEEPLCRCGDVELCTGGIDEDLDGLTDCADVDDCGDAPGCSETLCADGLDDDRDGLIDCLDPDCDGECPEVCEDGRDNDGDGLVDCEDADCVDHELCGELLCADGLDDDDDGLIDCEDDDCWGIACHPQGIRSQVTGGTMTLAIREIRSVTHTAGTQSIVTQSGTIEVPCGDGEGSTLNVVRTTGELASIRGEVRVLVPTESGSATETCEWGFSRVALDGEDRILDLGAREGFFVDSPERCRLARSTWLPTQLGRNANILSALGGRRYAPGTPQLVFGTATSNRTTEWQQSCYRYFSTYTRSTDLYATGVFGDEGTTEGG